MALGVNIVSTFDSKGIKRAISEFKKLEGAGQKATYGIRTIDSAAKQLAAVAAKAAIGVGVIGGLAVREFAKFDDAMNQSIAIMGNVSSAMRDEMTKAARQMAKTTTFSAEEAAKSYFYLASAGLNAEQSLKALPVVARFAQAGMFDMALATDLLTDAQSALGLTIRNNTVKNMENMARVSDVLVKANTLANATVEQFATALTNKAGAAMKSVNMDVEAGVAVLAALADQGIKAEEAGTQFSIALRDLQTKALDNTASFAAMNITVFDSQGNLRNMGDIIADLEGALAGASDETKKATLLQLGFADRSVATILALLGTSDAIKTYETQLRLAGGTTEDIAAKQLQSLQSQLKLAKNAIIDVAIQFGSALAPKVEAVTAFIRQLSDVIGAQGLGAGFKFTAGAITDFIGNMGALGNTIYTIIAAFVALRAVTIAATISQTLFKTALLTNPIGIVVAAIIALGVAIVAAYGKFEGFRNVVNSVINFILGMLEKLINNWIFVFNIIATAINAATWVLRKLGANIPEIGKLGEVSFGRLASAADNAAPSIVNVAQQIQNAESRLAGFGTVAKTALDPTRYYTLADAQRAVADAQKNVETLRKREHKDLVALKAATDQLSAAQGNLALITGDNATGSVGKAVKSTKEKIADFTSALREQTSAQRSLRDATKATAQAQNELKDANEDLAKMQEKFNRIVNGYGRDSKQAKDKQDDLDKAQRDVERSGYGIEEAVYAVRDAEKELAKVRLDPESNAQAIREAEIKLAEAKLSVADAEDRQRDATVALNKAQEALDATVNGAKDSSDAYKDALDKLNEAKKSQQDAIDRVTEAQEREADALYEVSRAQQKLNDLTKEYGKTLLELAKIKFDKFLPKVETPTTPVAPVGLASVYAGAAAAGAIDPGSFFDLNSGIANEYNVTINAGMGTDAQAVAREFVDYLKQYERANGYIPITAEYAAFAV